MSDLSLLLGPETLTGALYQSQTSKLKNVTLLSALSDELGVRPNEILAKGVKSFNFTKEPQFRAKFCGINVYEAAQELYYSELRIKSLKPKLSIILTPEQFRKTEISFSEMIYVVIDPNYLRPYKCKTPTCLYSHKNKAKMSEHEKNCSSETKMVFKEKIFREPQDTKAELIKLGVLNSQDKIYSFLCWDIETTFSPPDEMEFQQSSVESVASVVSIGLYSDHIKEVLVRENDAPGAAENLVKRFLARLESAQREHFDRCRPEIKTFYNFVCEKLKEKDLSVADQTKYRNFKNFLTQMFDLHILSFNGGRFDQPVIMEALLKYVDPERLTVIKNGSKYIFLKISNLKFLDACNYFPSGGLADFAKSFGVPTTKTIFPYELFRGIEEIKNTVTYPGIAKFFSSLGKTGNREVFFEEFKIVSQNFASINETLSFFGLDNLNVESFENLEKNEEIKSQLKVSPSIYFSEKSKFVSKMESGEYSSFLSVLIDYNLLDCKILFEAIENFNCTLKQCFGIELLSKISLPAISEQILWKMFDPEKGYIHSIGDKWGHINEKLRSGLMGGPCIPFYRHVELGPVGEFSKAVYFTPSGERFRRVTSYDFNGLSIKVVVCSSSSNRPRVPLGWFRSITENHFPAFVCH